MNNCYASGCEKGLHKCGIPNKNQKTESLVIVPSGRIDYCCECKKDHGYDCPLDTPKTTDSEDSRKKIAWRGALREVLEESMGRAYFELQFEEMWAAAIAEGYKQGVDDSITALPKKLEWKDGRPPKYPNATKVCEYIFEKTMQRANKELSDLVIYEHEK